MKKEEAAEKSLAYLIDGESASKGQIQDLYQMENYGLDYATNAGLMQSETEVEIVLPVVIDLDPVFRDYDKGEKVSFNGKWIGGTLIRTLDKIFITNLEKGIFNKISEGALEFALSEVTSKRVVIEKFKYVGEVGIQFKYGDKYSLVRVGFVPNEILNIMIDSGVFEKPGKVSEVLREARVIIDSYEFPWI